MVDRKIETALLSVFDKTGIVEFARALDRYGVKLISTGGTAALLRENGIPVRDLATYTGFPEIFDGRVKSIHPLVFGGILFRRDNLKDRETAKKMQIQPIDLVAANIYPFEEASKTEGSSLQDLIEMIDIGGPSIIRAAAKNYEYVTVVFDPADYLGITSELEARGGRISKETRMRLMVKAFQRISAYDAAISSFFQKNFIGEAQTFPERLVLSLQKIRDLRYGENPHQRACLYREMLSDSSIPPFGVVAGRKELSYTNLLDVDAAISIIQEFKEDHATVIVKHTNPCGGAVGLTLLESYQKALSTDPQSAFGGVYAFSRPLDKDVAEALSTQFVEVVLAPGYRPEALTVLTQKKDRRIIDTSNLSYQRSDRGPQPQFRSIITGILCQTQDDILLTRESIHVPTQRKPTDHEMRSLVFGWKFVKHVKSNAIVLSNNSQLLGVGAGQMSRIDSCRVAIQKAQQAGLEVDGAAMASDAFIPFKDTVDLASEAGLTSIIQPGGSIRDNEVIAAADEHRIAMIFTGIRHFKH